MHELLERYHAHAGAQLAEKWNLHSDIVQACALHHDERHAESRPVKIAMLSDLFAGILSKPGRDPTPAEAATWRKLGLTDIAARNVLRGVHE